MKKYKTSLAQRKASKKWKLLNPEHVKRIYKARVKRGDNCHASRKHLYGITKEQYLDLKKEQKGRCAICGKAFTAPPLVDHNHVTGKIRKLLCCPCNSVIGFAKDSIVILKKAIQYLKEN